MDLRNMRQLLAIRTHGSVAKAARALGMSQPSLSQAILRMEDQLKLKLIDRSPSGSVLTPIGEMIVDRAAKVVGETEQLIREAELIAGGEAGTICVGIGTSLKATFLPRFVDTIVSAFPGLCLHIQVVDRDKLLPMLTAGDLDLIICVLGSEISAEGLVATPIMTTQAVAVAAPSHPLAGVRDIPVERLAAYPLAGGTTNEFSNADMLGLQPGHEDKYVSNDYDVLVQLALSGAAAMIAPAFLARPLVQGGKLVELDLDWRFDATYAAITTRAAIYSPIVSKIIGQAAALGHDLQA